VKIWEKSEEIWAKCVKTFTELLYVHWFYKNATQNQNADVFFGDHALFSSFRAS